MLQVFDINKILRPSTGPVIDKQIALGDEIHFQISKICNDAIFKTRLYIFKKHLYINITT
jgi:hypothetical protein